MEEEEGGEGEVGEEGEVCGCRDCGLVEGVVVGGECGGDCEVFWGCYYF